MAHTHDVYDMENHFEINGSSRFIKETSETKLVVVQGDHKSEVLTFKMPRYIDGHDMTLCNKIRIHYINLDTKTNNKSADVYEVTDLTLCEECEDVLTFTWTIEAPATKYSGTLSFLVKFECTEGENVLYQWNTAKYVSVNVLAGIDNSEEFVEKYSNVLEEWYNELTKGADSIEELNQQAISEIELAKEDAKEDIQGKADATMAEMEQCSTNTYNSFKNNVDEKVARTLESIPEDYTTLDEELKEIKQSSIIVENLLDYDKFTLGFYHWSTGAFTRSDSYGNYGFIPCKANTRYCKNESGNQFVVFYDSFKTYISGLNGGGNSNFTTPENCAYVVIHATPNKSETTVLYEMAFLNRIDKMMIPSLALETQNVPFDFKITKDNAKFIVRKTNNMINPNDIVRGLYFSTTGVLTVDSNAFSSGFISVEVGKQYSRNGSGVKCSFWTADFKFLSATSSNPMTIPENCAYVNMYFPTEEIADNAYLIPTGEEMFCSYYLEQSIIVNSNAVGLKYGAIGDSITYGLASNNDYPTLVAETLGMEVINYGIGGNRLASTDHDSVSSPMCVRFAEMNDDLDIITVMGGTNDCSSAVPIGTNDSTDITTFKGALNVLCTGLLQKYPMKRIGFLTPIMSGNQTAETGQLKEYVEAIKEICALYSIPVLDLFHEGGFCCKVDENANGLLADGLHPSDEGNVVIARKVSEWIKTL